MDAFLIMNLLWTMARHMPAITDEILESLKEKLVNNLSKDLETFIKTRKESMLMSSLPNLLWSCRAMSINDSILLDKIDSLTIQLAP